jgi:hypothetical protein
VEYGLVDEVIANRPGKGGAEHSKSSEHPKPVEHPKPTP